METILRVLHPTDSSEAADRVLPLSVDLRFARKTGADRVTMTFSGCDECGDDRVGSTTGRTVRRAPCPVRVV